MSRQPNAKQVAKQLEKRAEIDAYFLKSFEELAVKNNGILGDPTGAPAFAYLRVSTDKQAEQKHGGLPRQLENIHVASLANKKRIEWASVYADDDSGFKQHREKLDQLMVILRRQGRGQAVVMEYKDRLARDADYQAMFFKDLERMGVEMVWWKDPGSPMMRRVTSAVEQEMMEFSKARMYEGRLSKAKRGNVVNNHAAYGYRLVDSNGEVSEEAKKDTCYGIREDTAAIVRELYRRIASAEPLGQIARDLEARGVPTARGCQRWYSSNIAPIIRNSVYKGEYIAHRLKIIETAVSSPDGVSFEWVEKEIKRPESEWIRVTVPPIVDAGLWQAANDMLDKNRITAARNNSKANPFLLGGLLKCATCGYSYSGWTRRADPRHRIQTERRGYECRRVTGSEESCHVRTIVASELDTAVWKAVCDALLNPDALISRLEADTYDDQNEQVERDIKQLEALLTTNAKQQARLLELALSSGLSDELFSSKGKLLEAEAARLKGKLDALIPQRANADALDFQKQLIEDSARELSVLHELGVQIEPPDEVKRQLLKVLVNRIDLHAHEGWIRIEGLLRGTYNIANGSPLRPVHNVASLPPRFTIHYSLKTNRVLSLKFNTNFTAAAS